MKAKQVSVLVIVLGRYVEWGWGCVCVFVFVCCKDASMYVCWMIESCVAACVSVGDCV